jgi:MFS family permease
MRKQWVLAIIVFAQFCCTSLWFAGNGIIDDLAVSFHLTDGALGHLTATVQFGFIAGTLIFAFFTIADRHSPSKVFFIAAILGALVNAAIIYPGNSYLSLLLFRFLTGFFLAGIYPVGMKIAADYFKEGLGLSLGFLVGALVVGTAFPHLLKSIGGRLNWQLVIITTSGFALVGGLLIGVLVPDGPNRSKAVGMDFKAIFTVFRSKEFRIAAIGYFGHMWELYAFWAFLPLILKAYLVLNPGVSFNVPLLSFTIIAIGGPACVVGGHLAKKFTAKKVAFYALFISGICSLASPLFFSLKNEYLFVGFLLIWGITVITDSPLFSTLVAHNAPSEKRATALTIVNSIGFAITIVSIELMNILSAHTDSHTIYTVLAIGPIIGLISMAQKAKLT